MSAPTIPVRRGTYWRDKERCASCAVTDALSYQHRAAVGMGGSKYLPTIPGGLTLCLPCNEACEHVMQTRALTFGWKIRRWQDPTLVPVFYPHEHAWFRLEGTTRTRIPAHVATEMMFAAHGDVWASWWAAEKVELFS